MENALIKQTELNTMSSIDNKNFLIENIHNYYDELIVNNSENNERVINLLLKKMSIDKRFDKIDAETKTVIAQTGISCLSNALKTFNLKKEKNNLQKENTELRELFLNNYNEKLLSLKKEIKKNQEDFLDLKNNADDMSLGQLANNINEFHNPNTSTEVSSQDIDDLLNGRTLEF